MIVFNFKKKLLIGAETPLLCERGEKLLSAFSVNEILAYFNKRHCSKVFIEQRLDFLAFTREAKNRKHLITIALCHLANVLDGISLA